MRKRRCGRRRSTRFLGTLGAQGYVGANVTLPHKEAALGRGGGRRGGAHDRRRQYAMARRAGRLCASNTDAYGFMTNLAEEAPDWNAGRPVLVLGAGGAARAILHGLLAKASAAVLLANRTRDRAEALARDFGPAVEVDRLG